MLFSVFREDHSLVFVVIWLSGCVHVGSDGNMTAVWTVIRFLLHPCFITFRLILTSTDKQAGFFEPTWLFCPFGAVQTNC